MFQFLAATCEAQIRVIQTVRVSFMLLLQDMFAAFVLVEMKCTSEIQIQGVQIRVARIPPAGLHLLVLAGELLNGPAPRQWFCIVSINPSLVCSCVSYVANLLICLLLVCCYVPSFARWFVACVFLVPRLGGFGAGIRIGGWRAVSADGSQGRGWRERSAFSQTPAWRDAMWCNI